MDHFNVLRPLSMILSIFFCLDMIDVSGTNGYLWAGTWNPQSKNGMSANLTGRHFLHCSWNRSGTKCIICDRRGSIILLDVKTNKWKKIGQVTPCPTLLQFGVERQDEFLAAFPGKSFSLSYNWRSCDKLFVRPHYLGGNLSRNFRTLNMTP
jgi:hypothetical protein